MRTIMKLATLSVLLLVSICFMSYGGTPGVIIGNDTLQGQNQDEAGRTGPVSYVVKSLIGARDTTNNVISTKWTPPGGFVFACRAIYNNRSTATILTVRTVNSTDTITVKLAAYGSTPPLFPLIHTIFKIGATDTLLTQLQITK